MKCVVCRLGDTEIGTTTVTLDQDGLVIVIRSVPGEICAQCGEGYFDEETGDRLEAIADDAKKEGQPVVVREYQAV